MASEIRANTLKNRVGLGTVSFTNTGPVVSGIVTANGLELNSVDTGSSAGPELKLFRNSASPADADYLGQVKFAGESDTGVERNYAKITGKILDASNGTEDGILEFAHIKGGSQTITGRWRSDSLQLLNSTNLTVDGDLDVDGHTNLDNVSIAGVTTSAGIVQAAQFKLLDNAKALYGDSGDLQIYHSTNSLIQNGTGSLQIVTTTGDLFLRGQDNITFNTAGNNERLRVSGSETFFNQSGADTDFRIRTPAQTHMFYVNAGNDQVSIKTSNAQSGAVLTVNGRTHIDTQLTLGSNSTLDAGAQATIYKPATNTLAFATAGANERLRIDNVGKVGIGTVPTKDLHVDGTIFASGATASLDGGLRIEPNNNGTNYGGVIYGGAYNDNNTAIYMRRGQDGNLNTIDVNSYSTFRVFTGGALASQTERLRIDSSGKSRFIKDAGSTNNAYSIATEINATTSGSAAANFGPALYLTHTFGGTNYAGSLITSQCDADVNTTHISFYPRNYGWTEAVRIKNDGKLLVGAAAIQYASSPLYVSGVNPVVGEFHHSDGGTGDQARISLGALALNPPSNRGVNLVGLNNGNGHDFVVQCSASHALGPSEKLRITSSGQLLLGETSAFDSNTAIQFRKDNSGNTADFVFRNRANNSNSRVQIKLSTLNRAANADVVAGIEKYQSGGMAFYNGENTNQYAQMSFFNNGWASLRLRNGNHSGYDVAHISGYWGTSNALMIEQGGPQSGTFKAIRFTTSHYGGERGYIGVTLGGTSYNSSSDYRMKQDVVDLTGAIDRVKSFKPRRFKWKEDPTYTVDGFLAHEASTVVPESVDGEKDAVDSEGDPKYQVMDNSKLVPVLTAALKEAIAKIETLEAKVAALEGS